MKTSTSMRGTFNLTIEDLAALLQMGKTPEIFTSQKDLIIAAIKDETGLDVVATKVPNMCISTLAMA